MNRLPVAASRQFVEEQQRRSAETPRRRCKRTLLFQTRPDDPAPERIPLGVHVQLVLHEQFSPRPAVTGSIRNSWLMSAQVSCGG